jgi:uncharacterized protein YbaP (TraB family)
MKKFIACLIFSLLLATPALCETSVWIANTDSSVMYIGGTIHLLRASDLPFPPEFDRAYDASELLIFEADIAGLQKPETQQAVMAKSMYTDGRTLDKVLSAEAYEELGKYCTAAGIPLASMNQLKPSIIALTLMMLEIQKLGIDQEGIDVFYYGKATTDKKPVEGLETVEEQVDMITSMGDGNESEFILHNIDELKNMGELFDKLVTAWKSGDEKTLNDVFLKDLEQKFPKLFTALIVDRNMKWLPRIEEHLLTPQTEFVLVGTAHLVGKVGVIEQLKKHGYEVKKLK